MRGAGLLLSGPALAGDAADGFEGRFIINRIFGYGFYALPEKAHVDRLDGYPQKLGKFLHRVAFHKSSIADAQEKIMYYIKNTGLRRAAETMPQGGGEERRMKEYTFTVKQTIKVTVPPGATDDDALEAARKKTRQYICWDDVAEMEIGEEEAT